MIEQLTLSDVYEHLTRCLTIISNRNHIYGIRGDGSFGLLYDVVRESMVREALLKCQRLLNDYFALQLCALGLSASEFESGTVYIPNPVMLRFRIQDGSVVEVDFHEQLYKSAVSIRGSDEER